MVFYKINIFKEIIFRALHDLLPDYVLNITQVDSTEQALAAVAGDFTPSAFVQGITGVDNVWERAAAAAGGRIIVPKQANNGVTAAVARKDTL